MCMHSLILYKCPASITFFRSFLLYHLFRRHSYHSLLFCVPMYIQYVWRYVAAKFGSNFGLQQVLLGDFFKHAFDGDGDDGGSCIDGRLTSTWNWCSRVGHKPYYHAFNLAGFQGLDGDWKDWERSRFRVMNYLIKRLSWSWVARWLQTNDFRFPAPGTWHTNEHSVPPTRKDASWNLNWPFGANLVVAHIQYTAQVNFLMCLCDFRALVFFLGRVLYMGLINNKKHSEIRPSRRAAHNSRRSSERCSRTTALREDKLRMSWSYPKRGKSYNRHRQNQQWVVVSLKCEMRGMEVWPRGV